MNKFQHSYPIPRGTLGEFSKITEEYLELVDAHRQKNGLIEIVELSDLIGAILHYLLKQYRILSPAIYLFCMARGFYKSIKRLGKRL